MKLGQNREQSRGFTSGGNYGRLINNKGQYRAIKHDKQPKG